MTIYARLAVGWTTGGEKNVTRQPDLDGLPLLSRQDITYTPQEQLPPRLNASIVEVTMADAAALAMVAADPRCLILRSWTVTTDANGAETVSADTAATKLTAGQRTAAATWLQARGFKAGDLADVDFSGLTRADVVDVLRTKLARATKG